jgi:hypothetical protein
MADFHLFDTEYRRVFAEVEGYMNDDNTAKLYGLDEAYNRLNTQLVFKFGYLNDISR